LKQKQKTEIVRESEEIVYKSLEEVLHGSMIPYTEHVVMDRALPRVEDGLKPVQRRILYSMMELGLEPDKPFRKSARIVGDCLGKYHPHGDTSVYDAMARMSQDFVLREPLVEGHGNFGSVDGDSPAAMRYTEARMAPLALELLRDLEKDTVRWSLNFDDTLKEPDMLPGRFPNLLVNGAYGIAVGVATNIPPHNLGEVIDGVVAYIENPNITLPEMMKIIKGPDFPTGGELILGDGIKSAYETGKGKITIRAKVNIEKNGDKSNLIITEIPYQVNKAALLQKIAELKEANKDKLACISEICDESDRNGMRAIIKLKKEANPQKVLEFLYKSTNLEIQFGINMVAIAGGKPKQLGLLEIISYYVEYQREIIVRRSKFDLDKAKDRAHIVEGLLIAIKNIDEVIRIIKKSQSVTEAKQKLKERFKLSEKQTQAILDMRLSRLVNLEKEKLENELKNLKELIDELTKILASKARQYTVVKKEILEIKKKYGSKRRSSIGKGTKIELTEAKDEPISVQKYDLVLSAGGTIKKVTAKNYSMSNKAISDGTTLCDVHTQILEEKTGDVVLIFTDKGNVIKTTIDSIKECKLREGGLALNKIEPSAKDEHPIKILTVEPKKNLVFYSKLGMVKKTSVEETLISKTYYQAVKINDGDALINVEYEDGGQVLMLSKDGMSLKFDLKEVPSQGRISAGVKGINLDEKDAVVYAGQVKEDGYVLLVTNTGYIKKISLKEFPVAQRYRKGLKYANFNTKNAEVIFAHAEESDFTIAVDFGLKILSMESKKIKEKDRLALGDEVIKRKFLGVYVAKI